MDANLNIDETQRLDIHSMTLEEARSKLKHFIKLFHVIGVQRKAAAR